MTTIGRVGFIGDLHAGSLSAAWPLDWIPGDVPHSGSRYLVECLSHLGASWPELDLLILMGDLIEGKAQKSKATGLYTAHLGQQVDGAIELLRPIAAKARRVLRVAGTMYHDQEDDPLGKLDLALGVERTAQVFNLRLPFTGDEQSAILNVAHHPAGGQVLYAGTKLDREILWSIIQSSVRKIPAARWIVRAHLHEFSVFRRKGRTMLLMPCMKLADGYAIKLDYERFQPDLGAVLMHRDDTDSSGWRFIETLYPNPQEDVLDFAEIAPEEISEKESRRRGAKSSSKARAPRR